MKVYISSDHAGFDLKNHLVEFLAKKGFDVVDNGPSEYNHDDDYPDTIAPTAKEVSNDPEARGIVIGRSGQGEAIVANKFKNIRAGVYYGGNMEIIKLMREHNDTNILALGAHSISNQEAEVAVDLWLSTKESDDERHTRRINKILSLENA